MMLKSKTILFSVICISLSGCGLMNNRQKAYTDEFKNTKTYTLKQLVNISESGSEISSATLTYERVISQVAENFNLYFIVSRSTDSFGIEKKGFMKVNGTNYEIFPETGRTEYNTKQETNTTTTTIKDSVSVKTQYNTDVKNFNWLTDKFIVRFTPEMVASISKTNEITFRFYFGPSPATFRIKGNNLRQVQKLFNPEK